MWSEAGIKAAKADFLVKQALRRAQEKFDGIANNANNANIDNKVEQLNNKSGVVKPNKSKKSITEQLNRLQISRSGNSLTIPTPYGVERKKSITKLLNRLNIGKCHDYMTELDCFGSLRISSSGNSPTVPVVTIPNSDELSSYEMASSIMDTPPEFDQFERPIPIHKPPYGGKKRKSKRMKSRYRKKYKGTRNNKTRRYRK